MSRDNSVSEATGGSLPEDQSSLATGTFVTLRPDRLWCLLSLLYDEYQMFFPWKQSCRNMKLATHFRAEVKKTWTFTSKFLLRLPPDVLRQRGKFTLRVTAPNILCSYIFSIHSLIW